MVFPRGSIALAGGGSIRGRAHGSLPAGMSDPNLWWFTPNPNTRKSKVVTVNSGNADKSPSSARGLPSDAPIGPDRCGVRRQHIGRGNRVNRANLENVDEMGIGERAQCLAGARANRGNPHPSFTVRRPAAPWGANSDNGPRKSLKSLKSQNLDEMDIGAGRWLPATTRANPWKSETAG